MKNSLNEEALSPRPRQVGASGQVSIGGDLGTSQPGKKNSCHIQGPWVTWGPRPDLLDREIGKLENAWLYPAVFVIHLSSKQRGRVLACSWTLGGCKQWERNSLILRLDLQLCFNLFLLMFFILFIYLTALGLSCNTQDLACRIFPCVWASPCLWYMGLLVPWHVGSQFPDQGPNSSPLHGKADSQPLDCQGSPPLNL